MSEILLLIVFPPIAFILGYLTVQIIIDIAWALMPAKDEEKDE